MSKYAKIASAPVPQSEPLDARQVKNNADGFVYAIDDWARLDRFLVLGSDAPTYYQTTRKLTRENAACVERCFDADPVRARNAIVNVSVDGRAPKNDAAIFALALGAVSKNDQARAVALGAVGDVCRTATHLFQFLGCARALGRGWGRGLKRAVAEWYDGKKVVDVAYQAVKYRAREGMTHMGALQLSHPVGGAQDEARRALYCWITGKEPESHEQAALLPRIVGQHLLAMKSEDPKEWARLAAAENLPWEALPTKALKEPEVWRALLPGMGLTALIRNLATMTELGVLKPLATEVGVAVARLSDRAALRKARVHPFNVLVAHAVYQSGAGVRGGRTWQPVGAVTDALEEAFYAAFENVEPTGKRTLIGLDVSGSMTSSLMGSPLEVCAGAAAMAMTTMRVERNWHVMAFNNRIEDLRLTAKDSLEAVLRKTRSINSGGTDCALPMIYALEAGLEVDVFQVFTDNETWAGTTHPKAALQRYRKKTGIPAKLVVVGMTATDFSIADPADGGMLDVVGFDSAAPSVIADFCRG